MAILRVPGATLYYETRGKGPLFLLIPGGNGDTCAYGSLAGFLSYWFTVATYDRRGFSRSYLTDAQDYSKRLETDADDARRLIQHLSTGPATIMGSSSGAIVALELLARHPSVVRMLIPHEPPAMKLLPDGEKLLHLLQEVYDLYRQSGTLPAVAKFTKQLANDKEAAALKYSMDARRGGSVAANAMYWFERELTVYPTADIPLEALEKYKDRIIPASGRESVNHFCYVPNQWLVEKLGLKLLNLSGGYMGYVFHAREFGLELLDALRKKNAFYAGL